ncbi:fibronectin type III domain-containing protein [Paenibacillus sp. LHD-117]|uniref:fibronectin type III domain-containing protein n=1 Tax=Paenibacillus sp. LHD-117 TaxID=3071412 RepID=UPI0027DF0FDE|nr:fibronectin type III domain-containing protein [Paenibacillus sp. LHD-117]MDQ6423553.1 fibronectin type III domain-containing protein [Paenibacillus sp. LHD-117]
MAASEKPPEVLPSWAQNEIKEMVNAGIIKGYEDGTFRPNKSVMTEQFVFMAERIVSLTTDISLSDEQKRGIQNMLLGSLPQDAAKPKGMLSRAASATILAFVMQEKDASKTTEFRDRETIPDWAQHAVASVTATGIMKGYPDGLFRGDKQISRAEAAVILYRFWKRIENKGLQLVYVKAVDDSGRKLNGANLIIHENTKKSVLARGKTGDNGDFIVLLPEAAYEINVLKGDLLGNLSVDTKKENNFIELIAKKAAIIQGKVNDINGAPKAGAVLAVTTNPTFFAVTDKNGHYTLHVLPERDYALKIVDDPEIIRVTNGAGDLWGSFVGNAVPASLRLLDQSNPKTEKCKCNVYDFTGTIKSPSGGSALTLQTLSLADPRIPGPSNGGGGNGPGTGGPGGGGPGTGGPGGGSGNPDRTPPAVPTGIVATAGNASVTLQWSPVADNDLEAYKVYTSLDGGASWDVGSNAGKGTTYTVNGLTNATTYTFSVSAIDKSGNESAKSRTVDATPIAPVASKLSSYAPTRLTGVASSEKVDLQWAAVSNNDLKGYNVYVSVDNGATWGPAKDAGAATSFAVEGLENDQAYMFSVSSYDLDDNESIKSAAFSAVPYDQKTPPSRPAKPTAEAGDSQAKLIWTAVPDAGTAGYYVYLSTDYGNSWFEKKDAGNHTSYTYTDLQNGVEYTASVIAYDRKGRQSGRSDAVQFVPRDAEAPAPPSQVSIDKVGNSVIGITWTPSIDNDLEMYRLYISADGGTTWDNIDARLETSYYFGELTNGTDYLFTVAAVDTSGNESERATPVSGTPLEGAAPFISGVEALNEKVLLWWPGIRGATGYKVYMTEDRGTTWNDVTLQPAWPTHEQSGLMNGKTYGFAISYVDDSGIESDKSNTIYAMPKPLTTPSGLTGTSVDGSVLLQWTASSDAYSYMIEVSEDDGQTWTTHYLDHDIFVDSGAKYQLRALPAGKTYTFAVKAQDVLGGESARSGTVKVEVAAPSDHIAPEIPYGLMALSNDTAVTLQWEELFEPDLAGYRLYISHDGVAWGAAKEIPKVSKYSVTGLSNGASYFFALSSIDNSGNESEKAVVISGIPVPPELPPSPLDVASEVSLTGETAFHDRFAFIYSGESPLQTGVQPGTIEENRPSVLRGTVFNKDGQPLDGVQITVLNHPEFGQTLTRTDGTFDMVVNGGTNWTIEYRKAGFLPVQRKVEAYWEDFSTMPDVVMLGLDTQVTEIDLINDANIQVAQGTPVTDEEGTRQATLLFEPGTEATMTLPNGNRVPLATMNVRATEYTVGENGMNQMPGELPSFVAYTYAVELSVDEAIAAGATGVEFNKPVHFYVDNFIEYEVGEGIPAAYYDLQTGKWVGMDNGVVIQIVSILEGIAQIDTDGDGNPDTEEQLAAFGFTLEERIKLGQLYEAGKTLWRTPLDHFTPADLNKPIALPDDVQMPDENVEENVSNNRKKFQRQQSLDKDSCKKSGSIIGCQEQSLGQAVPIVGTDLSLHYYSRLSEGYEFKRKIDIPVTGDEIPASLLGIDVEITIAGRHFKEYFEPGENISYEFVWDGKDAYGRTVNTSQPYLVKIGFRYPILYQSQDYSSFDSLWARLPATREKGGIDRKQGYASVYSTHRGVLDAVANPFEELGIAGWSLSAHHAYNHSGQTLYQGDGSVKRYEDTLVMENVNYRGVDGEFQLGSEYELRGATHGPGGETYLSFMNKTSDSSYHAEIFKLNEDGSLERLYTSNWAMEHVPEPNFDEEGKVYFAASNGYIYSKDLSEAYEFPYAVDHVAGKVNAYNDQYEPIPNGTLAMEADLETPNHLELGNDGTKYFIDMHALYKIEGDQTVTTMGIRLPKRLDRFGLDEGPAVPATIGTIDEIDRGPDGNLYMLDSNNLNTRIGTYTRIRMLKPDGTVVNVAGTVTEGPKQIWDGIRAEDARFRAHAMAVDSKGYVYFYEVDQQLLYRVTPTGIIEQYADYIIEQIKDEIKAVDGELPWHDDEPYIDMDGDGKFGKVSMVVKSVSSSGELLLEVSNWALPDHDRWQLYRIRPEHTFGFPASDGLLFHEFDTETGHHLSSRHSITGAMIHKFGYDAEGRLSTITDTNGNVTVVERDSEGKPTAIIAPGGQRTVLTVNDSGLVEIVNPAGESYAAEYDDKGLLMKFTDPMGYSKQYAYDAEGLLIRATTPNGGEKTLEREVSANGFEVRFTDEKGLTTRYETRRSASGVEVITTEPSGAQTQLRTTSSRTTETVYEDGTKLSVRTTPDPRWRDVLPMIAETQVTGADGQTSTYSEAYTVDLANPNDPLSVNHYSATFTTDGVSHSVTYDAGARTYTETSADGQIAKTTVLDSAGRVIREEYPGVEPLHHTYDNKGRLSEKRQGEHVLTYTYDERNRLIRVEDEKGNATGYTYDEADRVVSITIPGGSTYLKSYDKNGNLVAVTMPDGTTYQQQYDVNNLLIGFQPEGSANSLQIERNVDGSLKETTLASGRKVTYGTDEAGRLSELSDSSISRLFTYQGNTDQVAKVESTAALTGAKQSIDFTYTGSNVESAVWSGKANGVFSYQYDHLGRLIDIQATVTSKVNGPTSYEIELDWDENHDLSSWGPFQYKHDNPSRLTSEVTDGTFTITPSYDEFGRIAGQSYSLKGSEVYRVEYMYNDRNLIESKTVVSAEGTSVTKYEYDTNAQLTKVTTTGPDGEIIQAETYSYDSNRNRVSRDATDRGVETSVYGSYDRLQMVGEVPYSYDEDGNVTGRGEDTFVYGERGELLSATVEQTSYTYTYDALGRRVARESSHGESTVYLYGNPLDPLQLSAVVDPDGAVTTYYYDEAGVLIALEQGDQRYYVVSDSVNTPLMIVVESGNIVKTLKYDSYGVLLADSNPAFELAIGYAGGLADAATGLIRFGKRDYDANAGRWTSPDPLYFDAQQANLYGYVNNNPIMLRDPCGLFCVGGSAYGGVGGGVKVCLSDEGFSVCGELGLGAGAGVEVSPFEDLSKNEIGLEVAGKAQIGPITFKAGVEMKDRLLDGGCASAKLTGKISAAGATIDLVDPTKSTIKADPREIMKDLTKTGFKAEAAAKVKSCGQYRW